MQCLFSTKKKKTINKNDALVLFCNVVLKIKREREREGERLAVCEVKDNKHSDHAPRGFDHKSKLSLLKGYFALGFTSRLRTF